MDYLGLILNQAILFAAVYYATKIVNRRYERTHPTISSRYNPVKMAVLLALILPVTLLVVGFIWYLGTR